ncbi:MAG: hypothetical protein LBK44_03170 [Spirochaetales bacterium]|nr:hypothetical protein [Spirochaetales bacterium]
MQILRAFRYYPSRAQGLTRADKALRALRGFAGLLLPRRIWLFLTHRIF